MRAGPIEMFHNGTNTRLMYRNQLCVISIGPARIARPEAHDSDGPGTRTKFSGPGHPPAGQLPRRRPGLEGWEDDPTQIQCI